MSRFDRVVRRNQWRRAAPPVRPPRAADGTRQRRRPAVTFEAWEMLHGLREKNFQARKRWKRHDMGLAVTASDMHRAHGKTL